MHANDLLFTHSPLLCFDLHILKRQMFFQMLSSFFLKISIQQKPLGLTQALGPSLLPQPDLSLAVSSEC